MSRLNNDYSDNEETEYGDDGDGESTDDIFSPKDQFTGISTDSAEDPDAPVELKQQYAFGLDIDPVTGLPRITAMGRGKLARKIIETATSSGVAIQRDKDIVKRMFRPVTDQVIPPETYEIIAEILTFIYQINEAVVRDSAAEYLEREAFGDIVFEDYSEERNLVHIEEADQEEEEEELYTEADEPAPEYELIEEIVEEF